MFFLVPALRAITEDLILFRFLEKTGTPEERDSVINDLMQIDVLTKIDVQSRFFGKFRSFQPVLHSSPDSDCQIEEAKDRLAIYWRNHGWPRFTNRNMEMPPIRELAQKSDPGILEVVYDFIYRLASGEVHSSPRSLLRLGWGISQSSRENPMEATFSTEHLSIYYREVAQIYSTYIVCLWFELFDGKFGASERDEAAILELRECLLERNRWPEIVTFEEMNIKVPEPTHETFPNFLIFAMYNVINRDGFIAGMDTILKQEQ